MSPLEQVDDSAERQEPASRPDPDRDGRPPGAHRRGRVMKPLVSLVLPSNATAPGQARAALRDIPELDAIRDDASLVVSELVTNAVKHSGATDRDRITLSIFAEGDRVKIQVHDPARTDLMPRLRNLRSQEVGGLGLRLVNRIARRWDTECHDGRIVWADLAFGDAGGKAPERERQVNAGGSA
jgi:anti-sigma regulatory factor (Ser/Thr protein kinase)